MNHSPETDDYDPIEAYCVRCRTTVEAEEPQPVWTRRGQPATRGLCPVCGGVVFRIGRTGLHDERHRPDPVSVSDGEKRSRLKLARETVYMNYAPDDEETAQQLAADLEKSGLAVWLHDGNTRTAWASGVHPALRECARMVLVLSPATPNDVTVTQAWQFFRDQRKPLVIAHAVPSPVPDALRRTPRYELAEYKAALRQIVNVLG